SLVLLRVLSCVSFFPYTTLFRSQGILVAIVLFEVYRCVPRFVRFSRFFFFRCLFSRGLFGTRVTRCLKITSSSQQRKVIGHDFRSEEHTSELQSRENLVCRLLLE